MTERERDQGHGTPPRSAWDIYCLRCGFDKRWPAPECHHGPTSFLQEQVKRLTKPPRLVLDGLYNRRST